MSDVTRAAALRAIQSPTLRKVQTPEWAEDGIDCVYIRRLGADVYPEVQRTAERHKRDAAKLTEAELLAEWCVIGLCNAKGKQLFQKRDAKVLAKAPLTLLERCAMAFMKSSGLSERADRRRKKKCETRSGSSRSNGRTA